MSVYRYQGCLIFPCSAPFLKQEEHYQFSGTSGFIGAMSPRQRSPQSTPHQVTEPDDRHQHQSGNVRRGEYRPLGWAWRPQ
jgi:hypothetical protein